MSAAKLARARVLLLGLLGLACAAALGAAGAQVDIQVCAHCETELPGDALYCPYCGRAIDNRESIYCWRCGTLLPADARYCTLCGSEVCSDHGAT
ncbi:MAG: zinc ribbon domain-containing protein, partial [Candidatus Eisenbacteria bacterium]|nr:zinc ribbon domain-containing protein [Candidatus Eisenbacteria bacterium]